MHIKSSRKNYIALTYILLLPIIIAISACGGEDSQQKTALSSQQEANNNNSNTPGNNNISPTVETAETQSAEHKTTVELSAVANDEDGSIASYRWAQTSGQSVEIDDADTANASFLAPEVALNQKITLSFDVTVIDNNGSIATDSIDVEVSGPSNLAPNVNAGSDLTINQGNTVDLIVLADDDDGIASYSWTQTDGDTVIINNAETNNANFTAPTLVFGDDAIKLSFEITVTDNEGTTSTDAILVTVNPPDTAPVNQPPRVNAGNNRSVNSNTTIRMSALASDTDGSVVSYRWTQISGRPGSFNRTGTTNVNFTTPTVNVGEANQRLTLRVTVTDDDGATSTDTVNVTVRAPVNQAPTVSAGNRQEVEQRETVQLVAEASDPDPGGRIISYRWRQRSGTTITNLSGLTTSQLSFIAPSTTSGNNLTLRFSVTVTDNLGATATSSVTVVVVNSSNSAPTVNAGSNQTVQVLDTVTLTASASDSDGSITDYLWRQVDNGAPSISINNFRNRIANFTAPQSNTTETYQFRVTVTDNDDATDSDLVSITVNPTQSNTGQATVTWTAPTENTDGSTLNDLAGFTIYYGRNRNDLTNSAVINNSNQTSRTLRNLRNGTTYYFSITARNNSGIESERSPIRSKQIPE